MPSLSPLPALLQPLRVRRLGSASLARLSRASGTTGRVHSVFERAINVLWGDGRLVTLHGPGPLAAPFAVALHRLPARGTVRPGMAIGRESLDWREADCVPLEMPRGPLGFGTHALPERAGGLRAGGAARAQQALAASIAAGDARAFADAAYALIGSGEGLTPAGDDCVVGALAAIHRLAPGWLASRANPRGRLADAAWSRTTAVAREFLLEALDGRFAEPVLALLTSRSDDLARDAGRRLLAMGATSGADTLRGIRLACRALQARVATRRPA